MYTPLKYNLSDDDRREIVENHRAFQLAVAERANQKFGIQIIPTDQSVADNPNDWVATYTYQGGIIVNGASMVILHNRVAYEYDHQAHAPFREARAVVAAIEEINKLRKENPGYLEKYKYQAFRGDPLRYMFQGVGSVDAKVS